MRTARIVAEGAAFCHVISRVVWWEYVFAAMRSGSSFVPL